MCFYTMFIELCNEANKTPSKVAMEIGVSKSAVTRWRCGSLPSDATLQKIAKYFGVSISDLLGAETSSWCDASAFNEDKSDKLILHRRKIRRQDGRPVIRVSPAVYQILADLSDDTGRTISDIASAMIEFASERTEIE